MLTQTPIKDRFLAFCKQQGDKEFEFNSTEACALAQFGRYEHPNAERVYGGCYGYSYRYKDETSFRHEVVLERSKLWHCKTFADVVILHSDVAEYVVS